MLAWVLSLQTEFPIGITFFDFIPRDIFRAICSPYLEIEKKCGRNRMERNEQEFMGLRVDVATGGGVPYRVQRGTLRDTILERKQYPIARTLGLDAGTSNASWERVGRRRQGGLPIGDVAI